MNHRTMRRLGAAGPSVSAVGFGCMGLSPGYAVVERRQAIAVLERALDLGVTLFDTADAYGSGHNEELVATIARRRRDEVVVATKFGVRGVLGSPTARLDTSPAWVTAACDASLARLDVETIDLYYMHRRNPQVPIEETVGAMAELVTAGKVRWIGLCEVSPATLRAAHAVHPVAAVQVEYSLFTPDVVEGELLATARELDVAVVAYSPIGRGLLAGQVTLADDDQRRVLPRFAAQNLSHNLDLAAAVRRVADEIGCTPTQAALAWVLAQGEDILAIPGTGDVAHLELNVAADRLELTATQLAALSRSIPAHDVAGARYPEPAMAFLGR